HLQANLGRRILDSFRWAHARYRLLGLPTVPPSALKMHALQLIYVGVCTTLPQEVVTQGFSPALEQRFALVRRPVHPLRELKLSARDQQLLTALDYRPTLAELCILTGFTEEEA